MPGKMKQVTVEPIEMTTDPVLPSPPTAEKVAHKRNLFTKSPILTAEYNHEKLVEKANATLMSDVQTGNSSFGVVHMDYTGTDEATPPDLSIDGSDVVTGANGLPGTFYSPNLASPQEGVDPLTIPDDATSIQDIKPGYVNTDNTANPKKTGGKIHSVKLGQDYPAGEQGFSLYNK